MSLATLLLIILLIVILCGGGVGYRTGQVDLGGPAGALWLVLIVILILALIGRI